MVAVLEYGSFARDALAGGGGEICAVFQRSLYLRCSGERYACLGDRSVGRGPLNAIVSGPLESRSLLAGDWLAVSAAGARLWRPEPIKLHSRQPALAARIAALLRAAAARIPNEGLGGAIVHRSSPLIKRARPALAALERWLRDAGTAQVSPQAEALIGLGPGLTPSGDDYLGGMLVALRALGRHRRADALWAWLEPRAQSRTPAISRAHLHAAAAGEAHEALHGCLRALLDTRPAQWKRRLDRLDCVGHCSGWDALAGALAVARSARA